MKGQKLFVRPIEMPDHETVREFLVREERGDAIPACGLLAKLVGEIVAVVAMQITPDAVQIDDIVVARDVRKKRIGRYLVDEVGQIASRIDRTRLVAEGCGDADEFFRRIGFEREGSRWIRRL
jgi:N-acetylglutamate synthase-like GNAT family acetyltransferase